MLSKNDALKTIDSILPTEFAYSFFYHRQDIMVMVLDNNQGKRPECHNRLLDIFENNDNIEKLKTIYQIMCNTFYQEPSNDDEDCSDFHSRSLLGLFTDGESHNKIYPDIDFSCKSLI